MKLANRDFVTRYFVSKEIKFLERLFLSDCDSGLLSGSRFHSFINMYIHGIIPKTLNAIYSTMSISDECSNRAKETMDSLLVIIHKSVKDGSYIDGYTVVLEELTRYVKAYYKFREYYADTDDDFSIYLTAELKKTINVAVEIENENFFNVIVPYFKEIATSACLHRGIGESDNISLTFPWRELFYESIISTASLKNTGYPNRISAVLGDIACEDLK